jgi:hypothetical protein
MNKRLSVVLLTLILIAIATTIPVVLAKISLLYKQGYERGVADAQTNQNAGLGSATKMSPNDVDCDSDIDPQASNEDYCSGYQHGYADTSNKLLGK